MGPKKYEKVRACLCGSDNCFYCKGYNKRTRIKIIGILKECNASGDYKKATEELMEIVNKIF